MLGLIFSCSILTCHRHRSEFWRGESDWVIPTLLSQEPEGQSTHMLRKTPAEVNPWLSQSSNLNYCWVTVPITRFYFIQDGHECLSCSSVSCTWEPLLTPCSLKQAHSYGRFQVGWIKILKVPDSVTEIFQTSINYMLTHQLLTYPTTYRCHIIHLCTRHCVATASCLTPLLGSAKKFNT